MCWNWCVGSILSWKCLLVVICMSCFLLRIWRIFRVMSVMLF